MTHTPAVGPAQRRVERPAEDANQLAAPRLLLLTRFLVLGRDLPRHHDVMTLPKVIRLAIALCNHKDGLLQILVPRRNNARADAGHEKEEMAIVVEKEEEEETAIVVENEEEEEKSELMLIVDEEEEEEEENTSKKNCIKKISRSIKAVCKKFSVLIVCKSYDNDQEFIVAFLASFDKEVDARRYAQDTAGDHYNMYNVFVLKTNNFAFLSNIQPEQTAYRNKIINDIVNSKSSEQNQIEALKKEAIDSGIPLKITDIVDPTTKKNNKLK